MVHCTHARPWLSVRTAAPLGTHSTHSPTFHIPAWPAVRPRRCGHACIPSPTASQRASSSSALISTLVPFVNPHLLPHALLLCLVTLRWCPTCYLPWPPTACPFSWASMWNVEWHALPSLYGHISMPVWCAGLNANVVCRVCLWSQLNAKVVCRVCFWSQLNANVVCRVCLWSQLNAKVVCRG